MAKKKKWIQAASASIKKRGTEGVCTGPKFGGPTCPPGSKRYNLAKVFKGMAKKKKKAAWGSMIHAKSGIATREPTRGVGEAVTGNQHYVMQGMDAAQTGKLFQVPTRGTGEAVTGNQHYVMQGMDAAKHGKIIKAKTSTFAETHAANWAKRRGAATTGMRVGTAGTAYTSPGWTTKINKSLNKLKSMMKIGSKTTSLAAASKWSKIPKASQLKTLAKAGGRRSLALAGGPIGLGMYAGTMGAKAAVTSAFKGYKKEGKWTKEGMKRLESQARTREALMAKRNKARNAKTGTMIHAKDSAFISHQKAYDLAKAEKGEDRVTKADIAYQRTKHIKGKTGRHATGTMVRAAHGEEVLGKQQVPFTIEPASANLAEQRQGRKGAAVRGFDFKGVR